LENEWRLEFENLHPAYDGLREKTFNTAYFAAWVDRKNWPPDGGCLYARIACHGLVEFSDACHGHKFCQFPPLASLVPALHLAQWFTDDEPRIH